jgi:tRNA dimethylallyltransferase
MTSFDMSERMIRPVFCIMGPTASGKTPLAIALCERLPVQIVSVDSSQVYRGMDIGTAKPTAEEQTRAPHRLIDIRDPAQSYSVADFCTDALREINEIVCARRIPLLVGGSVFYFHALEHGLSDLPAADAQFRSRLVRQADRVGWPALHAQLAALDPESAKKIQPQDSQRIQRALEIHELTGMAPSAAKRARPGQKAPFRFIKIALMPGERERLHERIAQRFHGMLERGLVDEVDRLRSRKNLHSALPALRTAGYRQVWQYLTGTINYYEMSQMAISATRQLAKRQMTWLRHYQGVRLLSMDDKAALNRCMNIVTGQQKPVTSN